MRIITYCILLFLFPLFSFGQVKNVRLNAYTKVGATQISNGTFLNIGLGSKMHFKGFAFLTGLEMGYNQYEKPIFEGVTIGVQKKVTKNWKGEFNFLFSPVSQTFNEFNYNVLGHYKRRYFFASIGNNAKVLAINRTAKKEYGIPDSVSTSIKELGNLIYQIGGKYETFSKKWVFEVALTNFRDYRYEQETNPFMYLRAKMRTQGNGMFYGQMNFLEAGLNNIQFNRFGLELQFGYAWKLGN